VIAESYFSLRQPDGASLAKRDWLILPWLSLLTAFIAIFLVEIISRQIFHESKTSTLSCMILNDVQTGVRAIPNSVCWQKINEGPTVEYRFNECGHRTPLPCKSKDLSTFRIVSIGASISEGFGVPYGQSFPARLPTELSMLSSRKYEVYNEALEWRGPQTVDLLFSDALSAKPDLILWTIHPLDLQMPLLPWWITESYKNEDIKDEQSIWDRLLKAYREKPIPLLLARLWKRLLDPLSQTSSMFLLQHLFYSSESQYLKNYLQNDNAGFLMKRSSSWRTYFQQFDRVTADVASRAEKAGLPLVVAVIPQRAEAMLIATKNWPQNVDPFAFGNEIKLIAEAHGAIYLDLLSGFREIANPGRLYYPVDGHLNSDGHALVAKLLAEKLADGIVPAREHAR
jgi:hypothetical protein